MGVELVPEAAPEEQSAVDRAVAELDGETSSAWWRAGVVEALERAPSDGHRPSAYEAARSPRSTLGATRA
jgi:hypothetical protein